MDMPPNGGLPPLNQRRRFPFNIFRRRPRGPSESRANEDPPAGWARHGIHFAMLRFCGYRDRPHVEDIINLVIPARHNFARFIFGLRANRLWTLFEESPPHLMEAASETDAEPEMCVICMENLEEGELVRTMQCGHTFHVGCIGPWIDDRNECPVCRDPFFVATVVL